MAAFFGEVVENQSRAFWDVDDNLNEDDSVDFPPEVELQVSFKDNAEILFENKIFILIHGPLTTGFAETCLLTDADVVAEVKERSDDAAAIPARKDYEDYLSPQKKPPKTTKLYALKESVIVCVCSPDLEITQAHGFVECISPWLVKSENVIALTCESRTSYLTDEVELPDAFMRELTTEYYKGSTFSKRVKQPNMIGGIPAGLLTYCEIFKIPGVLYVVYTDSYIADSITAQPLVELFSQLPINLLKAGKPTFKKRLYYGAEIESNLYM